jgi:hypothetical protein
VLAVFEKAVASGMKRKWDAPAASSRRKLPGNGGVLALVGILAPSKVADHPQEHVPEDYVDQKITAEGQDGPKCGRAFHESARHVDGGDEAGSRRGKDMRDSAPQRTVREIDFRFP